VGEVFAQMPKSVCGIMNLPLAVQNDSHPMAVFWENGDFQRAFEIG